MTDDRDVYTHGHQEPVLRSHRWRTAANSAAYLLPHLRSGQDLLDVGCGPGTITAELADAVRPGRVVGMDREPAVIDEARATHPGVDWQVGDAYAIDAPDASFDVVHAHQVLQHLTDPPGALREMKRVLRPGGRLAVRDSDYGAFTWFPPVAALDRWLELYHDVCRHNSAEADAGRRLPSWVGAAGFAELEISSSTWTFADAESRSWWGGLWADRVLGSSFSQQALAYGLSTIGELEVIAGAWREWAAAPEGLWVVVHVEVLARP